MQRDDEGLAPGEEKLIPEWSVDADDQIVAFGLLLFAAFFALLGWNALTGGDDDTTEPFAEVAGSAENGDAALDTPIGAAGAPASAPDTTAAPTTTAAPSTTAAAPTTTEAAIDPAPAVAAGIAAFASASSSVTDGTATLTGFVGTELDKTAAGDAAAAVDGITSVDNRLVVVQPEVAAALEASGVVDPEVEMDDTAATVRGEVADEPARAAALAAAVAVPGVSAVVDELSLPAAVTAINELNELFELEPIQFASSSAEILPASFDTLDQAAAILIDNSAPIEVQGYTDVQGPEVTNLTLSQARADAVVAYLADKGVDGDLLTATGYGETTQFGEGEDAEALAANRRVRFELI